MLLKTFLSVLTLFLRTDGGLGVHMTDVGQSLLPLSPHDVIQSASNQGRSLSQSAVL